MRVLGYGGGKSGFWWFKVEENMCFKNVEKTLSEEQEKHSFRIRKTKKNFAFGFQVVLGYGGGKMVFMDLWLTKT